MYSLNTVLSSPWTCEGTVGGHWLKQMQVGGVANECDSDFFFCSLYVSIWVKGGVFHVICTLGHRYSMIMINKGTQ